MTSKSRSSTEDVLAALEQRFAKRRSAPEVDRRDAIEAYHLAAAVLHVFDPRELKPYGASSASVDPVTTLFTDSVPAVGWRQKRLRSLKPDMRRRALDRLGGREGMQAALQANPGRIETALQQIFERWVRGETIEPERLPYVELEHLRQLYEWGLDRFGGLPERSRLEVARVKRAAVGVFEHLVDEHFVGRNSELQALRDYVGVVSPSRWSKVRRFLSGNCKPPLVVVGPGGTGKTALIGRFLLEHVDSSAGGWFPFAYLPFDSETLDVREPFTLLVTAASQLSAQVGHADERSRERQLLDKAFDEFRSVVGHYRDERGILRQRANIAASQGSRLAGLSEAEDALYTSFAALLHAISSSAGAQQKTAEVPVLLVFDTFEEVLYRTREELLGLWRMLGGVQEIFAPLRVVMASRVQPRPFKVGDREPEVLQLGDLGEKNATTLLQRLGILERDTAQAIVRQIGGNPLSLRLAARVAQAEKVDTNGISGVETKRFFMLSLTPELIRGQLYRRILDHIHDEDVRALAHPGMVLRRVTAGLIQAVLAPACGLEGVDKARSGDLFERLRQEHALVSMAADGSLHYREEVRRPMLDLLARDKPVELKRIHEQAIKYYSRRSRSTSVPNAVERAEEIYHRLMLGAERYELNQAWMEGVERYLIPAIEEIPTAQRTWLAERMSIELPPEAYEQADLIGWERLYGRKALEALRYEGPTRVLALLGEREKRTRESALFAIEARALLALDRPADALTLVDNALAHYSPVGNMGRLAELLWIRAQAALALRQVQEAAKTLRQLAGLATSLTSPLPRVQALTELVDVEMTLASTNVAAIRDALAAALGRLSEAQVDAERSIVRLALTRLGSGYAATTKRLVPLVVHDWLFIARERHLDVRSALAEVQHLIRGSRQAGLTRLADNIAKRGNDSNAALAMVEKVIELVEAYVDDAKEADPYLTEVMLHVMRVEGATLRGATLAGLDAYREPWEMLAAPEALA